VTSLLVLLVGNGLVFLGVVKWYVGGLAGDSAVRRERVGWAR